MDNQPAEVGTVEKKHRHRAPSIKQIKFLQLLNQGYPKSRAMREAGYSKGTIRGAYRHNILKSSGILQGIDDMRNELRNSKLNGIYLAKKFEQWLDAKKTDKDDYKTQIAAFREYKEIFKPQEGESKIKRRVTFEEFIGEDKNEGGL